MDFIVPAVPRVKIKETEKREKYLDLAWGLKKLWKMKETVIIFTQPLHSGMIWLMINFLSGV